MDASTKQVLSTIGARLRKARLENNMTQEVLAGPEFTKGYVSALERGAVRPSLKALDVFSRRLSIPMSEFLAARLDENTSPERDSFQEDLVYQFNYVRALIRTGNPDEGLNILSRIEADAQNFMRKLPAKIRYSLPFLRGLAYLDKGEYSQAVTELDNALAIVEKEGDPAIVAQIRNVIGTAHIKLNQPALALEQHLICLKSVKSHEVQDPNLRLSIYSNLADDYAALGDTKKSISTNQEALKLLTGANDLQHQGACFWNISTGYNSKGDWAQAKTYATRALHLFDAADNQSVAGAVAMKLAAALTREDKLEEAKEQLVKAGEYLVVAGDRGQQSRLYLEYAELARHKGDLDEAASYAAQSIEMSDALRRETTSPSGSQAHDATQRGYARALYAAALIEEKRGNRQEVDRLFGLAIDVTDKTSLNDTTSELAFAYAQILEERGDHRKAMEYYRLAAQVSKS